MLHNTFTMTKPFVELGHSKIKLWISLSCRSWHGVVYIQTQVQLSAFYYTTPVWFFSITRSILTHLLFAYICFYHPYVGLVKLHVFNYTPSSAVDIIICEVDVSVSDPYIVSTEAAVLPIGDFSGRHTTIQPKLLTYWLQQMSCKV